jgi:isopenicillin N synthase-like dioxygenase
LTFCSTPRKDIDVLTDSRADVIVDDLLRQGYSRIPLDDAEAARLARVFAAGAEFFAQDVNELKRFSGSSTNHGYRAFGDEYSISPDRPDQNDSFSLWADESSTIPCADEISPFLGALSDWRAVLLPLATSIFGALGQRYGAGEPISFERAAYLQLNNYNLASPDIDFLQDAHEDGHLMTFINTTAAGLEIRDTPDDFTPVTTTANEVLVMPGSVLTKMTGAQVPPLYHRVRNCGIVGRKSLMYFVNPQMDVPLAPWLSNDTNAGIDILEYARTAPGMFGLPDIEAV